MEINRFNQLIDNFHQERRLLLKYQNLISPNLALHHSLEWNEREKQNDIEKIKEDIKECDLQINDLKVQLSYKQQEITNAKISQSIRLSQISRLSGLSQPVGMDRTYFFIDRYPNSIINEQNHLSQSNSNNITTLTFKNSVEYLQQLGVTRTGEGMILESKLKETTNLLEGHLFALASSISSVNLNPKNHAYQTPQIQQLSNEGNKSLKESEILQRRILTTVIEILTLRLQMIKLQRETIEEENQLEIVEKKYEKESTHLNKLLQNTLKEYEDKYNEEYQTRSKRYDKEIGRLERQIEKETNLIEVSKEKLEKKLNKLKEDTEESKEKYDRLKTRHNLELEGYRNEMKGLKQQLRHITHVMKHRERFNLRQQRDFIEEDITLEDMIDNNNNTDCNDDNANNLK